MRLLALALLLAGTAAAAAAPLGDAEIRAELVGRDIEWWENGGWHAGSLVLAPDGRAEITVDTPAPSADVGHWTVSGGRICTVWDSVRAGAEKCYSLERGGAGDFVTSGGNVFRVRAAGV
ncbi:hypothetical protein [Oharaeibacter diazotrophicus]|uniref:Protease inhibitor Inh n=1 Tax=Oharaeibacter diazotrophicus TaxID=1920512 RepID=A0A4R6RGL3_9HYPH|nr:hypothetical protein [Oharaeibacter diazotrophicus]TDP85450.1 hypothetical protein EDD54_2303 [Oharaeibacter diazotrophicus]BBE74420.1 hypothetical protein OHA_1_04051 [Pleomorphomonas sp. SM30]GLS75884.1 hypothetical protein GCM10007904_12190 [Oharaeibacter diazotrophicus]